MCVCVCSYLYAFQRMKCQSISNKNKLVSHQQNTVIRLSYQFYSCFYFVIAFLSATFILHHKKTCTCFVIANRDRRLANGYKTNSLIKLNKLSFFVPVAACFFCSLSPLEDCIQIGEIFLSSVCFLSLNSSVCQDFFCEYVFVCLFVCFSCIYPNNVYQFFSLFLLFNTMS